ncbi:MAG: efflux RND transporter permease subunit [Fidelibacterota bacterium]
MYSIKKPIAILMLTIAIVIFGIRSGQNMNISFLPEIEYPEFIVLCDYPNSSSEEVEKYIVQPLEESISAISGISDIISYSRDGYGIIHIQFRWNIDVKYTLLRLREKIDAMTDRFPENADRPYIMDFNPGSLPIVQLTFSGETSLSELSTFAEDVLKPRLSQIDGVASAMVTGMPQKAIQIIVNPQKCEQYNIDYGSIQNAILANLPNQSFSHEVKVGYARHKLTVEFPIKNLQQMLKIPITNNHNEHIQLGKIAAIKREPLPFYGHNYDNGNPALTISIFKESGANAIDAAQMAITEINKINDKFPDFSFNVIKNQGKYVQQAMDSLKQSILLGAFLAFFVILLFLKDIRYSIILALIIPVSLLFTFNMLYLHSITFNIMTLGGLALGIGLIVDNGIVMLDAINKNYNKDNVDQSIHRGVKEVGRAIAGSTFTTIAIFFPIIYVKGYAAILFKEQALAIIYVLVVSLLAALTLIPAFFKMSISRKEKIFHNEELKKKFLVKRLLMKGLRFAFFLPGYLLKFLEKLLSLLLKPFYYLFDKTYNWLEEKYHRLLDVFLNNKNRLFLILLILVVIAVIGWQFFLSRQYWPEVSSDRIEITIETSGEFPYDIIQTKTQATIEKLLALENVNNVSVNTFDPYSGSKNSLQAINFTPGYYTIQFFVNLKTAIKDKQFSRKIYKKAISLPYNQIAISRPTPLQKEMSGKKGKNIVVYLEGDDEKSRSEMAEKLAQWLDARASEVTVNTGGIKQVYMANFNENILKKYNLPPEKSAQKLKIMASGDRIGLWQEGSHKIPIYLNAGQSAIKSLPKLMQQKNNLRNLPLRNEQLFDITKTEKVLEQKRVNKKRVISVEAYTPSKNITALTQELNNWIRNNQSPNVEVFLSGESLRTAKSFSDLFKAFLLATVIVYLILAAQFESFLHPLNIILTVPIGFMGAVLGLMIFGLSLNVISIIGIVMLIGIGVNDAIVKLDYMVTLKQQNMSVREAVLKTSKDKFRPVMMTTLTTIVAMLPMAFGYGGNAEINQPLAVTIIGGLFFTTVLTLFITPVVFEMMERE